MTIAKIERAYSRLYSDTGQTVAYVEWVDAKGVKGRTEGSPTNLHMAELFKRAAREGAPVTQEAW